MNTLSRLEAFLCPSPSEVPQGGISHSPQSSVSSSSSASLPVPEVTTADAGPSSAVTSASVNTSATPPNARRVRRRRRRPPTSTSIKLPPPATPLLLRVALALWSVLLSFWRSLVGDTRAVRTLRQRHRRLRGAAGVIPVAIELSPPRLEASSDEGSGSEMDESWPSPDPVTRALPDEPERPPVADASFSVRLRSSQSKELSLTGVIDTDEERAVVAVSKPRTRLLPNPMATSLLDPSVPAVPHRHTPQPGVPRAPRIHQTPFHLQKTLILDLDETLIHSTSRPIGAGHAGGGMLGMGSGLFGRRSRREGHTIEVVLNGRSTTYHVYKRPFVDFFLKKVSVV